MQLTPAGQEVEYAAFWGVASRFLDWAPSVIFLFCYEVLGSMVIGLQSLVIFFVCAAAIYWTVDMEKGMADVSGKLELRRVTEVAGLKEDKIVE